MSRQAENLKRLGPVVVAQKVVGGQQDNAFDAYRLLIASKAYSTYIKVIISYICKE